MVPEAQRAAGAATPIRILSGPATRLDNPYGIAEAVSCGRRVAEINAAAPGDVSQIVALS